MWLFCFVSANETGLNLLRQFFTRSGRLSEIEIAGENFERLLLTPPRIGFTVQQYQYRFRFIRFVKVYARSNREKEYRAS